MVGFWRHAFPSDPLSIYGKRFITCGGNIAFNSFLSPSIWNRKWARSAIADCEKVLKKGEGKRKPYVVVFWKPEKNRQISFFFWNVKKWIVRIIEVKGGKIENVNRKIYPESAFYTFIVNLW